MTHRIARRLRELGADGNAGGVFVNTQHTTNEPFVALSTSNSRVQTGALPVERAKKPATWTPPGVVNQRVAARRSTLVPR